MIIFGIDPGSHNTGFGVVQRVGSRLSCLAAGVLRAPEGEPLAARLEPIFLELRRMLQLQRPDHVFVESPFHHKNARSALILGHARGVALLAARLEGVLIGEVSPAEVKKAVTGNGHAPKPQVAEMVRKILGIEERMAADAADALAVAIAGAHRASSPLMRLLEARR